MEYFLQNLINALQWGSFYAVISIGYSMVYGVLMLFNFAHGDIFMVGTYIGLGIATIFLALFSAFLPSWMIFVLVVVVTMFLASFIGVFVEVVGYRPLRGAPRASAAITGLMIGIIFETGTLIILGAQRFSFPRPDKVDLIQYRGCLFYQCEGDDHRYLSYPDARPSPLYPEDQMGHGHACHEL